MHKEVSSLKARSDLAVELRNDIEAMEKEKETVQAKIQRMERKVSMHRTKYSWFAVMDTIFIFPGQYKF